MLPEKELPEVRVPQEFLNVIDRTGFGKTIDEKVRLSLAIGLFVEKAVSLERAAELAGKKLASFIEILQTKKIAWMKRNFNNDMNLFSMFKRVNKHQDLLFLYFLDHTPNWLSISLYNLTLPERFFFSIPQCYHLCWLIIFE